MDDINKVFLTIEKLSGDAKFDLSNMLNKINTMRGIHKQLLLRKHAYNMGIDSLNFQIRLLTMDYEYMNNKLKFINNRFYCDYYKFHKVVLKYINDNVSEPDILGCLNKSKYPVYDDLDVFIEYPFENVIDMQSDIADIIFSLQKLVINKDIDTHKDEGDSKNGIDIHNLINDNNHIVKLIDEQVKLFINYLNVFNVYHMKYLSDFITRMSLLYKQIESSTKPKSVDEEQDFLLTGICLIRPSITR